MKREKKTSASVSTGPAKKTPLTAAERAARTAAAKQLILKSARKTSRELDEEIDAESDDELCMNLATEAVRKRAAAKASAKAAAKSANRARAKSESRTTTVSAPGSAPVAELASSTEAPAAAIAPVELFPHGISVNSTLGRPVLILKDKSTIEVLPVWMHPLDAGVALAELAQGSSGSSPHSVTKRVLEMAGLELEACVFTELVGHHQFADLVFKGSPPGKRLRVRADEAMSFCLQARARFFGTKDLMARCRALDVDLSSLEQNLNGGLLPGLKTEIENSSKKHPYVM